MSGTQKLTPALSTPGRELLRREIYKGLADRAAGCVEDLDVDALQRLDLAVERLDAPQLQQRRAHA